jgi:drug/metabolite transporter (DMT)-like permease
VRLLIQIALIGFITLTFFYSDKAGVNSGIMSTNFSSCLVFVAILFYCKYKQKMNKFDYLGSLFILGSVVFIAIGGNNRTSESTDVTDGEIKEISSGALIGAIVFGLLVGLTFSLNALHMKYCQDDLHYPGEVMMLDQNTTFGLFLLPFYIYI